MKYLITSDWHLGLTFDGINRHDDIKKCVNNIISDAIESQIDVLIHCGDVFHSNTPSLDNAFSDFIDICYKLEQNKIQAYFLTGNHDIYYEDGRQSALFPITKINFKFIKIISTIKLVILDDILSVFLPYMSRYSISKLQVPIEKTIQNMIKNCNGIRKKILYSHCDWEGALLGSDGRMMRGHKFPILLSVLDEFDYVFNGHIHKAQTMKKIPRCEIVGSPEIINFDERNDTKSYIVLTL